MFLTFCLLEEGDHKNGVVDRRRDGTGVECRWRDFRGDTGEITNQFDASVNSSKIFKVAQTK